jgi:hypothetical protein
MFQDLFTTFVAIEAQAQKFDVAVLLGAGAGLLLVGLVIWLAGLAFSRFISAIIGAIVAVAAAFTLTAGKLSAVILAGATGLIAGAILRRPIFALAAAILAASCTIGVVSTKTDTAARISQTTPSENSPILSAGESWRHTCTWAEDLFHNIQASAAKQSHSVYFSAAIAAIVAFIITIAVKNLGAAIGCSTLGTIMSMTGLVILLFYKGAQPVEFMADKPMLAAGIFAGMIAFGAVIQLLLMKPRKGKTIVAPAKRMEEAAPIEEPKPVSISLKPVSDQ